MKKSIILKSFLVILMCGMLIFAITPVYAATDEGFEDILNDNTSNTGNTSGNSASTNTNSANRNRNTNSNSSNVQNLNALRNSSANTANTANTLPKTGIADSLPTVLLVVVFAISAVYAYKKIKDYRNID